MKNTIQLYADDKKKIKGYPITSPDRVIDQDGRSIKKILDNQNKTINEILNKGTTTETLEKVTKQEIDRQIKNGTIAALTIEDNSITSNKYRNESITNEKIHESVYSDAAGYLCALLDKNAYDVIASNTNAWSAEGNAVTTNSDGTYTLQAGCFRSLFVRMDGDLVADKPFSIMLPVPTMSEEGIIVTRYTKKTGGYDSVKHKLRVFNGIATISNLSYPEEAKNIEILIDNRNGTTPIIFGKPSVITAPVPFLYNSLTIEDVDSAINSSNMIIGGNSSMSLTDMQRFKHLNCKEVRAVDTHVQVNINQSIDIQSDRANGFLFFIYSIADELIPGQYISASIDIIKDVQSSFVSILFRDKSHNPIGNEIKLAKQNNKFIKNEILIPNNAKVLEYRIDNRNEEQSILSINNIRLIAGKRSEWIRIPQKELDLSTENIMTNIFPNTKCDRLDWINYTQGTPKYEIVKNGLKFYATSSSTTCIGYRFDTELPIGEYLRYSINISDFLVSNKTTEFEFNIITYDAKNKELDRIVQSITASKEYTGKIFLDERTTNVLLRFDLAGADNYYIFKDIIIGGKKAQLANMITKDSLTTEKITKNIFPNTKCNRLDWINYTQGTPKYEIAESGLKFYAESSNTSCIGYQFTQGFNTNEFLTYSINIPEVSLIADTPEFDFNIIAYGSDNREINRVTEKITKSNTYQGKIFLNNNTSKVLLRFDIAGIGNYYVFKDIIIGGAQVPLYDIVTKDDLGVINQNSSGDIIMYVSTNGSDTNPGTLQSPKKTVNEALRCGANDIRLFGGTYEEQISFKNSNKKKISITRHEITKEVIFSDPNRVLTSNESQVEGYAKVFKAPMTKKLSTNNIWLFQDGVVDTLTLINGSERHPLQRGYEYRCWDTKIKQCSSTDLQTALQEIENSEEYKWCVFEDTLYFSRPSAVTKTNPICCSLSQSLFKNTDGLELHVSGIISKYMIFDIQWSVNSVIADCKAANVCGAGAFVYNSAINCQFIRCEATHAFSGSNGDGFNGHCSSTGDKYSKQLTATFIDCWSHDNNDDGYSDHERAETTIIGGLYEYNKKGGITPSYGAHVTCYNVLSRQNYSGFNYTGTATEAEGGKHGQVICYNCVAENNTRGGAKTGFIVGSGYNSMKLVNCKSIGHEIGYEANSRGNVLELIDCGTLNDRTVKHGNGQIIVKNTTMVV